MTARALSGAICCLVVLCWGCETSRSEPNPRVFEAAVHRWLTCIECADGELRTVVALSGVDPREWTVGMLARALSEGPDGDVRQNLRYKVMADWVLLGGQVGTGRAEEAWIDLYEGNYTRVFRLRGAMGLRAIGTPAAEDSLSAILSRDSASAFLDPRTRGLVATVVP